MSRRVLTPIHLFKAILFSIGYYRQFPINTKGAQKYGCENGAFVLHGNGAGAPGSFTSARQPPIPVPFKLPSIIAFCAAWMAEDFDIVGFSFFRR